MKFKVKFKSFSQEDALREGRKPYARPQRAHDARKEYRRQQGNWRNMIPEE